MARKNKKIAPLPHLSSSKEQQIADFFEKQNKNVKFKTRNIKKRLFVGFVLIILLSGSLFYWKANSLLDSLHEGKKAEIVNEAKKELNVQPVNNNENMLGLDKAITILAIGSDQRAYIKGSRSDSIIVMRIIPETKTVSLLSIPRDTWVNVPGYGMHKINDAYQLGKTKLLIKTVSQYLGIKINHFVQTDFHGFSEIVKYLGGVYLSIDQRYYHKNDGTVENNWGDINIKPGYQKIKPYSALAWVRYRHTDSDYHRAARQQLFLKEVGKQLQLENLDVDKMMALIEIVTKASTSDIDNISEALKIANTLRSVDSQNLVRITLQGADSTNDQGQYILIPTEQNKKDALYAWSHPGKKIVSQKMIGKIAKKKKTIKSAQLQVVKDKENALRIHKATKNIEVCVPYKKPVGYYWPKTQIAVNNYKLENYPAVAFYTTEDNGNSVLYNFTTWQKVPILQKPSKTVVVGTKQYNLYFESGKLHIVSWKDKNVVSWVSNTIRNNLSTKEMLALAKGCH